jgi:DnaJ-class molecular chaperone
MKRYAIRPCDTCKGVGYIFRKTAAINPSKEECYTCRGAGAFILIFEEILATNENLEKYKKELAVR